MKEQELKELSNPNSPNNRAFDEKTEPLNPSFRYTSIRIRDKNSVRLVDPLPQNNRLTFKNSRRSSGNDFTLALLNMPQEAENCVIFPWDDELKEFVIEDEQKVAAVENLTKEDVDTVFERLKRSPFHDLYGNMHLKLMLPFLFLLIGIILFLLFFKDSVHIAQNNNTVIVVFFALFGFIFLLIIVISIFWARYLKRRLAARENDFTRILNELNSEVFCDKDLFWKCGKLGTYIQLDLNYKFKALNEDGQRSKGSNSARNKISISMNFEQTNMLAQILENTRTTPNNK